MKSKATWLLGLLWIGLLSPAWAMATHALKSESLEKVSLQLEWKYQFEYAGFIMAKEKGFYAQAGLDVALREYTPQSEPLEQVLSHRSNYGIQNSSLVVHDGKLEPIILMATYLQRSPLVFVTQKEIQTPHDFVGKTIMGTHDELKYSSLALLLKHFFISEENASFQPHSFNVDDFVAHKVDVMTAFRTNQLYALDKQHVAYNVIDPADYGFLMSAVNLFTSYDEVLAHPERTRRFIEASNQGWVYALAHPEEAIALIYSKYSQQKSIEALRFEAAMTQKMMLLDFFKIGATNKDLSLRAKDQLQYSGLLQPDQRLGNFIFEDILREFDHHLNLTEQQKIYLKDKKELHLCIDPEWMPFEGFEKGQYVGISADIFAGFAEKLPVPIHVVKSRSWQESIQKAKNRQCDLFSLASSTPERLEYMDFTTPYLDLPIVMATKTDVSFIDDIASIQEKRLGVVKGYAIAELLRKKHPDMHIVDVASISDGLRRVESGELFGYIDNLMVIANAIQQNFTGTLKVSSRLNENVHLAVGTRNDEPVLHGIFEMLVQDLRHADLQRVYNKWVSVRQDVALDYSPFWKGLAVFIILLLAFLYHYSQLRKLNAELARLSVTDKLTGLYNRVQTDEVLAQNKARVDRYGEGALVIMLDIDFFKTINDTHGHLVGDRVLIELGELLQRNVRASDCVGRWGGEEFLIVCSNTQLVEGTHLTEKLLQTVREHTFPTVGSVTLSAGVGIIAKEHSIQKTLMDVDQALYFSKQHGRDQVAVVGGVAAPSTLRT